MSVQAPFDPNFCFPLKDLETARVKLTPFVVAYPNPLRGFFDVSETHPELHRYIPFEPFPTLVDFLEWYESQVRSDTAHVLFAVMDKTCPSERSDIPGAFAGIIGLFFSSVSQSCTEVGYVMTFPKFQRTHVTSNAIGLLLHYCLNLPADGGLGLRRVQWQANSKNISSVRAAERLGFMKEGLIRWQRVLPPTKEGKKTREGDPIDGPGRDTVMLSMCWDDWEEKKARVDELINRV